MKTALRVIALLLVIIALGLWLAGGQNTGFTKTVKTTQEVDPVTELHYPVEKKGFYPGVDFLVAAAALGFALWGTSFFVHKKSTAHP